MASILQQTRPLNRNAPKADIKILAMFDSCRKATAVHPKKEYLRCKLIRGHKRAIRQIICGKIPKATIHRFDANDSKSQSIWLMMKHLCQEYESEFKTFSKTESGPATDGRSKKDSDCAKSSEKSFNSNFCKSYFTSKNIRDSFSLYLDLIFAQFDPKELNRKFEFFCCRGEVHSVDCLEKWVNLLEYLKKDMFLEIGLDALEIDNMSISFPPVESLKEFAEINI